MNAKALVTNIQRFSLHDGPGIRTTVFLKGCSLHCPWCANPENLLPYPEAYVKDGKRGTYGQFLSCDELYDEIIKDRIFYDQPDESSEFGIQRGGITFSGGEPLLQFDVLEPLLIKLKDEDVHISVETCLFVPKDMLTIALKYVDLFYVDIKILDKKKCRDILGGSLKQYFSNLEYLFSVHKTVVFRIPIIGGFTDDVANIDRVIDSLRKFHPAKIELIQEHNLGRSKYATLGKKAPVLDTVTDELMAFYRNKIMAKTGIRAEICKI